MTLSRADELLVFDPTAEGTFAPHAVGIGVDDLAGKVVGFIDNAKPNFHVLADELATVLTERYGVREVVIRAKRHPAMGAPTELLDELAAKCDVVITGSGD